MFPGFNPLDATFHKRFGSQRAGIDFGGRLGRSEFVRFGHPNSAFLYFPILSSHQITVVGQA